MRDLSIAAVMSRANIAAARGDLDAFLEQLARERYDLAAGLIDEISSKGATDAALTLADHIIDGTDADGED